MDDGTIGTLETLQPMDDDSVHRAECERFKAAALARILRGIELSEPFILLVEHGIRISRHCLSSRFP